jgi:hypothetical protein
VSELLPQPLSGLEPVWEYDPPAWLDADRVQALPVRQLPMPSAAGGLTRASEIGDAATAREAAGPSGPGRFTRPSRSSQDHALIDWKGTTGSSRFGLSSVRLPFGAIFAEDYEHLDRLRDPAAD